MEISLPHCAILEITTSVFLYSKECACGAINIKHSSLSLLCKNIRACKDSNPGFLGVWSCSRLLTGFFHAGSVCPVQCGVSSVALVALYGNVTLHLGACPS